MLCTYPLPPHLEVIVFLSDCKQLEFIIFDNISVFATEDSVDDLFKPSTVLVVNRQ